MPAKAPTSDPVVATRLAAIGLRIRDRRKALDVSAGTAAAAAGLSRVTLHRIERGEPSVTMGAYMSTLAALGLGIELTSNGETRKPATATATVTKELPAHIPIAAYPQLQRLAWHLPGVTEVTPAEALGLYERNWRHLDRGNLEASERELLTTLVREQGKGYLLV